MFIDEATHEKMKNTKVKAKDILLNITGGSIGRTTLITDDFKTANINQHVSIIRLINLDIRDYIHKLVMSPYFQGRIMDVQVGVSREGLSITSLKQLLVPLPPIKEQLEINMIVDNLFKLSSNLDAEIQNMRERAKELLHGLLISILGKENIISNTTKGNEIHSHKRDIIYNSETMLMELVELLNKYGTLHAEDLWRMSKYPNDIDKFYAELKEQIECKKTIKESIEKGYLELV